MTIGAHNPLLLHLPTNRDSFLHVRFPRCDPKAHTLRVSYLRYHREDI